jgi:exopolysaccharide biosynthesis predicted pyruvyltransferase EpsI
MNLVENINCFLQKYKNKTIVYVPNPGNVGDAIISYVTRKLFLENEIKFKVQDFKGAVNDKIVFYGGGGALIDRYKNAINYIKNNVNKSKEFVILPHTINAYSNFFKKAPKNLKIFCREKTSYNILYNLVSHKENLFLSKDLAFYLQVKPQKGTGTLNCFNSSVEGTKIPAQRNLDISAQWLNSWVRGKDVKKATRIFIKCIKQYHRVRTNRMYVAIVAALLNKQVSFYPNNYYKCNAVYEFSMKEFKNVRFINLTGIPYL